MIMTNNIRYKSISAYIIELELPPDSITDEAFKEYIDKNYTLYSTNKALIKKITHKIKDKTLHAIKNFNRYEHDFETVYRINETIEVHKSDTNIMGIHYFLTKDAAFHYELLKYVKKYTGFNTIRLYNGTKYGDYNYNGGILSGQHVQWKKKIKIVECAYKNNELDGTYTKWYDSGQLQMRCNYILGVLHGLKEEWHPNRKKKSVQNYTNDKLDGSYATWYNNCRKWECGTYSLGKRVGLWQEWYKNSQKKLISNYNEPGRLYGQYCTWTYNGRIEKKII